MTENVVKKEGTGRLLQMMGKYKWLEYLGCALSAVAAVLFIGPFVSLYYVLKTLFDSGGDLSIMNTDLMIHYGWLAFGLAVAGLLVYFAALMCTHIASFKTMRNLRYSLMQHLTSLPLGFHVNNPSGKIRKVVDTNVAELEAQLAHHLPDLAGALVAPVAVIVVMAFFDWKLGVICMIPIILGFLIQFVWMVRRNNAKFIDEYQKSLAEMENSAVEYVRGISVVKVFGQTVKSFKNFYSSIMRYKDFVLKYTISMRPMMGAFTTLINGSFLLLIPFGIIMAQAATGNDFILSFVFYVAFIPAISKSMMKLLYVGSTTAMVNDSLRRIDALFAEEPLPEPSSPAVPSNSSIEFSGVTFTYENSEIPAVKDVNFRAEEGTVTALVGASGSGKTTVARLVPRFWDVDSGVISIGDVNVKDIGTKELMKKVGFVFQDTYLFKNTIYENIRMGNPNATREEVLKAAELAQCNDILEKLPDGIDTMIGSKGTYLSGGEQQRIALARAMLKDTPIVLLDEATAFADPENESNIQKALDELIKNKTVIMIAHRLSTVRNADRIIVMKDGMMIETGNHDELLEKKGAYASMWSDYQRSVKWNLSGVNA